jgi:hypothetical protein
MMICTTMEITGRGAQYSLNARRIWRQSQQ